ncbi:putative reverse transcriptase, RNA-dependent DNA polymerase [Tanacetum coccineum]
MQEAASSSVQVTTVWTLVDLPHGKRAIGTKGVYRNKKDERVIVIRNKQDITQGYNPEDGIDYDELFCCNVKSAFLYGKIKEEVYICQPLGFEDPEFPDRVYKVEKALYDLHQAPRAWYETLLTYLLDNGFKRGSIDKTLFQVTPKVSHLHVVKRIFRYLKGQPKLGLWYPKDLPFDLEAYTNSDYAGASLDRKSTTGGYQFLGSRLISWQCKKETIVANSTTEAEYVLASIKNPVFHSKTKHIEIRHYFIRDSYEKRLIQMIKIHTDHNVADLLTKEIDVSRFQYLIASIGMLNP